MFQTGNHGFSWFFHVVWYVYPVDKIVHHQPAAGVQDKVQFGSQQHLTFFHVTLENCQRFEISWSSKFPVKKMFFFAQLSWYPIDDGFHRISQDFTLSILDQSQHVPACPSYRGSSSENWLASGISSSTGTAGATGATGSTASELS